MPGGDQWAPRIIAGLVLITGLLLGRAARSEDPEPTNPLEKAFQEADEAVRKNPESAQAYVVRAQAWVALGSPEHARGDLDQAVSVEPESIGPYLARGTFLLKHGDLDLALQDMNKACELDPTESATWVCRAGGRFNQGRFSLALEDLNEALRLKPEEPDYLHFRARVQSARHESELAIADLDEVLKLQSDDADLIYERGTYRITARDPQAGMRDIDEAIHMNPQEIHYYAKRAAIWADQKDFDRALAECDLIFRQFPDHWLAFQIRSYVRGVMGQYDDALGDVESAIRASQEEEAGFFQRARLRAYQSQFEEAIEDLTLCLEIKPRYVEALLLRAYSRLQLKQIDLAADDLDEAVRIAPEDPNAYEMRGKFHFGNGDHQTALADFDEAVKWHPRSVSLLLERAELRLTMNRTQGVRDDLVKAEELDPTEARVFLVRARWKQRLQPDADVMDDLDRAIQLAPDNPEIRKARASELNSQGRHTEAAADYDVLLQQTPDDDSLLLQRARVWLFAEEFDKALSDVDSVLKRQDRIDVLMTRAAILEYTGEIEKAREDLKRVIEIVSASVAATAKEGRLLDVDLNFSLAPRGAAAAAASAETSDSKPESKTKSDKIPSVAESLKTLTEDRCSPSEKTLAALISWRGNLAEATGDYEQALRDYERAIQLDFNCDTAWARRMWIESTSPDPNRRKNERSIAGDAILRNSTSTDTRDALRIRAAAYANSSDFEQAVNCQRTFIEQATAAGVPQPMLEQLNAELHLYESRQPCREQMSGAEAIRMHNVIGFRLNARQRRQSRRPVSALSAQQPTAEPALTTNNYSVADLVAGAPRFLRVAVAADGTAQFAEPPATETKEPPAVRPDPALAAELKSLQRSIESEIEPDSWEWSDGPGTITADTSERTLQIHQTDEVHAEIERFLAALRQQRSQRVVLTIRVATLRDVALQSALDLDEEPRDALFGTVRLSPDQVRRFHELVNTSNQAAGMKDLEIKLVHSQTAVTKLRRRLLDQTTEELRELKVTWSATDEHCALKLYIPQVRAFELSPDESLLVDLTDIQQPATGESPDDEPAAPSAERIVLLITPHIMPQATSESRAP